MARFARLRARLTAVPTVAALVLGGLILPTVAATTAGAEPIGVQQRPSTMVTADSLPTAQINGVVWAQLIVGNTVYVGGEFTSARPAGSPLGTNESVRYNMMAYNLTTGELLPFAPNVNRQVRTIAASPDGTKLYIGGDFTTVNGFGHYRVAALTLDGNIINGFAGGLDYYASAVTVTNSAVYVGGAFSTANGITRTKLAAFDPTTGALLNWAPSANNTVRALVMTPDGTKVIAGGSFTTMNSIANQMGVVALDPTTGDVITSFLTNTVVKNGGANAAITALATDGTYIYGGGYRFGTGGNLEGMFKADAVTGAVQWIEDCHGDTYGVYASSYAVYQVGHAHYCGNNMGWPQPTVWNFNRAIAFTKDATGTLIHEPLGYANWNNTPSPSLVSWFPRLDIGAYSGLDQAAWSVTGNDTYVVLGGEFPLVNGGAQQGLARFAVKPIAPGVMGGQLSGALYTPTLISPTAGTVRISFPANWDRDSRTLTYRVMRDGVNNAPAYTTTVDSSEFERPALGYLDTGLVAGSSHSYRLQVTDTDGNVTWGDSLSILADGAAASPALSSYGQTVLNQGANLYWPMNETAGTTLRDWATNGYNDAVIESAVTLNQPGVVAGDGSMTFSGNSGSDLAGSGSLISTNVFSAEAWFKTTSNRGGRILGFSDLKAGTSGHRDRQIYMNNTGKLSFGVWNATSQTAQSVTSVNSYNDGNWHQAVATMGPGGIALYVDGVKVGFRTDTVLGEKYVGYWRVGGDSVSGYSNTGSSGYLAGSIDEVSVYPTVLTSQLINAQYNASGRTSIAPSDPYGAAVYYDEPTLFWRLGESTGNTAADSAGGFNPGGYNGGNTKSQTGAITGTTNTSVAFNGSNGFVSSNNSFVNPTTYSVEAWFKTTTTQGGKIIGFGSAKTGLSSSYDRHIYMQNDGKLVFGANSAATIITSPVALNDGLWHHVVGTQGAAGMALYVDGVAAGTNAQVLPASYTGYWRVGGDRTWGSTSSYLNGTIDEAAVYPYALSATRATAHFTSGGGLLPNVLPTAAFVPSQYKLTTSVDGSTSTDSDGTIVSYSWNWGDGTANGTGVTASHSYLAAGTYTIALTVTDNRNGTNTASHTVTAVANVLPTAAFTPTLTYLNGSFDASASTDTDGTIASYAWDFGDGTTGTGVTTTHTYVAGTYTATLTVTDNDGGTAVSTQSVTATNPPNVPPTASFTTGINHLVVSVDGSASVDPDGSIASYAWDLGDGSTATGPTATYTYLAAGTYTITLTVTDNEGSTGVKTTSVTVAPNAAPTAVISTSSNGALVNVNGSASTDSDGTITSHAWDFGDGTTGTGAVTSHTYAALGVYTITLTVIDNDGVTGTATTSVNLIPAFYVNDTFARTVASGWGTADLGGAWVVGSGPSAASVSGGYGRMPVAKGGTRIATLPTVAGQTNLDLRVTLNLDKAPTGGNTMVSGVLRKTVDGEYRVTAVLTTAGGVTLQIIRVASGVSTTLRAVSITGLSYTAGTDLNLRLMVTGTTTTALSAKVWTGGTTEPATWQNTTTDAAPTAALQGAGQVALMTYVSNSATNAPVVASFKALSVQASS